MGLPFGMSTVNIAGLDLCARDSAANTDFILTDADGWDGKTKPSISVTPNVRRPGGTAGRSYSGSRHVALAGWLETDVPSSLLTAIDTLNASFGLDDTLMTVTEFGTDRWVMARLEDEVIIKRVSPRAASWSAQVLIEDWRKFGAEVSGSAFLPSSTGGLTIPFTVPFTIDAVTVSGQVSLNNPGNETGPVRLRIDGPCAGPVVTHMGSGLSLVFSASLVLAAGEWIDVDMEAQTVLANGQASRNTWITSRGWSGFEPGMNSWAFSAAGYDPASKLTVFGTPAWQ